MSEFVSVVAELIEDLKKDAHLPKGDSFAVLIVEDNDADRLLMRLVLEEFGFTVVSVTSGEDAIISCDHHVFAAVFLDLKLQGMMTGLEVLEVLKKRTPPPRVIIVTGAADSSFGSELARIGGYFEIVHKPLDRAAIEQLFSGRKP